MVWQPNEASRTLAVRPVYGRFGDQFIILAVATKRDFERKVRLAKERAAQYR